MPLSEEERQEMEQEVLNITAHLSSPVSEIGDWKLIKHQEYALAGKQSPYDMADYHAKRQAARDRINELQSLLNA